MVQLLEYLLGSNIKRENAKKTELDLRDMTCEEIGFKKTKTINCFA